MSELELKARKDRKKKFEALKSFVLGTIILGITGTLIFVFFVVLGKANENYAENTEAYETDKIEQIANELNIEPNEVILLDYESDLYDVYSTSKGKYRVVFKRVDDFKAELKSLVKAEQE